jgi:RecA/RadA recombinase
MVKAYLDKYKDAAVLFYDSEFGAPQAYFNTFGIDTSRVVHTPITDMEQLKFDITSQINALERGDRVIIVIDSIGNLASKKEAEDALDGKSVGDMTRAKQIKSIFRIITPHLTIKDIPLIVVNHTYMEQTLYPKAIVSGGTGPYYSADNIFIIGRQQEKEGSDLTGYSFVINVEKSRFVREKSRIPITVSFEGGISTWSGLMEVALESGHVVKPKNGWYQRVDLDSGEVNEKNYRLADTDNKDFWMPILKSKTFREFIEKKYMITSASIINDEELSEAYSND